MQLNPDVHHRYALDRQERLLADAAAHRPSPGHRFARIASALQAPKTGSTSRSVRPGDPALAERG